MTIQDRDASQFSAGTFQLRSCSSKILMDTFVATLFQRHAPQDQLEFIPRLHVRPLIEARRRIETLQTQAALAFGETVLARAVQSAGLAWDSSEAHSAIYDTERTAALFCDIVNRWRALATYRPWETKATRA